MISPSTTSSRLPSHFGLDPYQQFWFSTTEATIEATQHHVEGIVANMDDYLRIKPRLYPDHTAAIESMRPWAERQGTRRSGGLGNSSKASSGFPAP